MGWQKGYTLPNARCSHPHPSSAYASGGEFKVRATVKRKGVGHCRVARTQQAATKTGLR